jgi:LuxR family maltose regulon positive regulatory protein
MIAAPLAPAHAVDRPQLRASLDGAIGAPLTLVIAPAGSGKTVLLSQWVASRPDLRFVWIDVDRTHDDPARLAHRLLDGLAAVVPTAATLHDGLTTGGIGLGQPFLDSLTELLEAAPSPVLIFDDLHNLSNRAIVEDLWWLADHLPPSAHLVFSSRMDSRQALNGHRLRYALLELRQAQLAFDSDVAAEVLHRIVGAPATDATVSSIMDSTEGWAAGVQLSAISLRHQDDPDLFARRLAGTDRLISDYLSEEVLSAQSAERRDLLLRLSALDRMSPNLVESVLDLPDAGAVLTELERSSMFVMQLDGSSGWFRFHHLFRDLLRYRLRARHPEEETRILNAAAEWHEQHGDVTAAIDCLLQARSWDRAIALMLSRGREVFERGQTASIARWLGAMPESERQARPMAETLYGIALGMSGQAALAEDVLRGLAARADLEPGIRLVVQSYLSARVQFRPQTSVSVDAAREAMRLLRDHADISPPNLLGLTDRALLHTVALTSRGRAHFLAGEFTEARRWLGRALDSPGAQYSTYRVHLLGSLALLEAWSGRLRIGQHLADEALALARDVGVLIHPAPADAHLALALIAIHRGEPQHGAAARSEGSARAASNVRTQLLWIDVLEAVLAGEAADEGAWPAGPPPAIVEDGLDAAAHRARRFAGEPGVPRRVPAVWSATLVEAVADALANQRTGRARALLDAATFEPASDLPIATIEHDVLSAWLAHAEGRPTDSRRHLTAALELAAEHGVVSVFLWAGADVLQLVRQLPSPATPFRTEILARAQEHLRPMAAGDLLSEPLTDREREILVFLPSRLTNAELAARFYVSVNTIKTHTAHIYRKLDAPNRSAAVTRATELGIL